MTLQEFNSKYIYVSDMTQYGVEDLWEVMELQDGKYYGDCESYVATLIAKVDGMKQLELWYLERSYGIEKVGHCVAKDLNTGLFIDCNYQTFVSENTMFNRWEVTHRFTKFEWFKGLLMLKYLNYSHERLQLA